MGFRPAKRRYGQISLHDPGLLATSARLRRFEVQCEQSLKIPGLSFANRTEAD